MAMPVRALKLQGVKNLRGLATQTSAKTHDLHQGKPQVKQTKLPNGLTVVALENYSPISRVGVFVRAGARLEAPGQLGATHALRIAAGLSTQNSTTFGITRNIEYIGGSLTATSNREDLHYIVETGRDHISAPVAYLGDTVTRPAFKPWELSDNSFRMKIDRKRMKKQPEVRLMELLHAAAFKSGLSNSLYSPKHMIGKHDHNLLMDFWSQHFITNRIAVVGLGVELPYLVEAIEKTFSFNVGPLSEIVKPKFTAGNLKKETGGNVTYVSVVAEGSS
jgi:ubiquinol-cytochrome c reductase core subunit 2